MILSGKYEIVSTLGQGGMGRVYQVRHRGLDTLYALKVLLPQFADQPELVKRFHNEARIMARLQHPNIVRVFDIDRDGAQHYFVMEYIEGESLQRIIAQRAPLALPDLLRIARQIAQALTHAHGHGVVHRDIKPSNILVDASGRVVVTDFGIAKLLDDQDTRLTSTGMMIGTLRYASPEQIRGDADIDPRSDIFSLGMVLYELATGETFFEDLSGQAIIGRQLYETVDHNPEKLSDPALRRLVGRCIHKDRGQRHADGAALLEALDRIADDAPPDPDTEPDPRRGASARPGRHAAWLVLILVLGYAGWRWLPGLLAPAPLAIVDALPERTEVRLAEGNDRRFGVTLVGGDRTRDLRFDWKLDGSTVADTPTWTYHADFDSAGDHEVTLTVGAGTGETITRNWSVTVVPTNRPPVIVDFRPPRSSLELDRALQFGVRAKDPDNDPIELRWQLDGAVLTTAGDAPTLSPMSLAPGDHRLTVRVRDPAGAEDRHQWTLQVPEPVRPPDAEPPSAPEDPIAEEDAAPPRSETAPQALEVRPDTASLTLPVCESRLFRVDGDSEDFHWRLDGELQPEPGPRLALRFDETGQHRLEVEASDTGLDHRWSIEVVARPPDQKQAAAWLERYRQALSRRDYAELRQLGFSTEIVARLRDRLDSRQRYSVHLENLQARFGDSALQLDFDRVERWYDHETYSMVVNYSAERLMLRREGCNRIVAERAG
ncbi:MAG: protein kinase [Candidatus Competibacterales bacterium]|nr:protein kinase [Candidatus Competibacterales bacterium]